MAYAEWIAVKVVVSKSIGTVGIRNATLQWGKFYRYTNKDDEISTEEVSSMNVQAGSPQWIASCGRENASSGTQGSFDCYDGNTKMGTFSWDDPWKSGATNTRASRRHRRTMLASPAAATLRARTSARSP
ncbi:aegerolysin family protein [Pseudomonas aeruginosa]|nr:aegerolysin family protein [Pseudomonas aeruginosa]